MSDDFDPVKVQRYWRAEWLDTISEFCDLDVQRRQWLDLNNKNPYYCFVGLMSEYFDSILFQLGVSEPNNGREFISPDELSAVACFHEVADAYQAPAGNKYDNAAVLADPAWARVVASAQEGRRRLRLLLVDEDELAILDGTAPPRAPE